MNLLAWLVGFCIALIAVTQFLVDGIKEWLPAKFTKGFEKVWALIVSLALSLLAPVFFRSLPADILALLQIPAFLLVMPIIVRIVIGILISRGSEKFHDLLGPSAGNGNGNVSKLLYGDADKTNEKGGG